jgi:hypothetical protein
MSALTIVSPLVQPGATVKPGLYALDKPLTLTEAVPTLSSGKPLADVLTGALDASIVKITFGALLYRLSASSAVDIYDGSSAWTPEAAFDPSAPSLKPAPYAFDKASKTWKATFMASALKDAAKPTFPTDPSTLAPRYGFVSLLAYTDKSGASHAARSARTSPFGLVGSTSASRVTGGALAGSAPTQDMNAADGLTMQVKDATGNVVGEITVSSNTSVSPAILVRLTSPLVSIGLDWDGSATITSTGKTTVNAPTIVLNGELHAQKIQYVPAAGGAPKFL